MKIAVVIPCYRTKAHIMGVLGAIGPEVSSIFVVDDRCPEATGDFVESTNTDPRVVVIRNEVNLGVGGAVMAGYRAAIAAGAEVLVKIDGDGQMDPSILKRFVAPIERGQADYTKGNRFYDLEHIGRMPLVRLIGNAGLSFMSKLSTGYWHVFDPTNGYTAIHARIAAHLPFERIASRYFFETDLLFRLNTLRAAVVDVPMDARYGDETSSLNVRRALFEFSIKHARNFFKRIFYNYFLRDMTLASLELVLGLMLVTFGVTFGGYHWARGIELGVATPTGIIMLAAMPFLVGLQLLLAFVGFDVSNVPRRAMHGDLPERQPATQAAPSPARQPVA